jgi:hypothetical protein
MYCLNCGHSLLGCPLYKCPECGWPFNPSDAHSFARQRLSPRLAALLEVCLGVLQVFGVGHIYAGELRRGVALMAGYWAGLSMLLVFVIGTPVGAYVLATYWLLTAGVSSFAAAKAASFPVVPRYP